MTRQLGLLGLLWIGYGALHSLLASLNCKRWVAARRPDWLPAYRLIYNALALLLLIPPLALTLTWSGPPLWQWTGLWGWMADVAALLALAGFVWSARYYDLPTFIGLRQWRSGNRNPLDQEAFHLSPLHRFVRHPWYCFGLVLIWSQDMDAARLLTALILTGYFVIGSRLEERKLLVYHGDVYRRYREQVPGLLPLPWKSLSREAAATLEAAARHLPATPPS